MVAPTTGTALFVDDAGQRGESVSRAAAGALLVWIADLGTLMVVLIVGMAYLFLHHDLRAYEVVGATLVLLITGGFTGVLLLGLWQPARLRRLLGWLQQAANRLGGWFRRPALLPEDWADKHASGFSAAALEIAVHPRRLYRPFAVAMGSQVVDLASLYALFLAFHQPVGLGTLVAGFSIGVVFWIVSITPQGVGVVEGVMALVYTSLGVPPQRAIVIALAFRGLTLWLPVAIGFLLLQRVKSFGAVQHGRAEVWSVRAVGVLTGVMGVMNVLSAVRPGLADRVALVARFSPLEVRHGSHLTAALAGFALLLLARQLWRRKRVAWLLTLIVLSISVISHLLKGLDYEEALIAAALGAWLLVLRPHFHARSDPPSIGQGLRALAAALTFTLGYGLLGFYLLDRHFSVSFTLGGAARQTVTMFTQFYDPGLQPLTGFGRYFAQSIYTVCAVALGYALVMLFRPVLVREPATAAERERARSIVQAHGRSSLARFTLLDDKSYHFSPGGSLIAYVVKGHVALALGDPVGPPEDVAAAVSGFIASCARNDWHAAFYQTLPDYLDTYRAAGFDTLCIGHEGIVSLAEFSLAGRDGKSLRGAVNRLSRLGYRAELHEPPLADSLREELRIVSDQWLTMMRGTEKRFSLGWFDDEYIRSSLVMAVHDGEGFVEAFANIVPEYQRNEITIDLMRRRPGVEHGVMDRLFVSLFAWAQAQGYATFSLGLSPLAGVGQEVGDRVVERALHYIYEHTNRFYNFRGLHAFKGKFHPEWSPRYLVYSGPGNLPAVAIAVIRADSGDSFVWDHLRGALRERRARREQVAT